MDICLVLSCSLWSQNRWIVIQNSSYVLVGPDYHFHLKILDRANKPQMYVFQSEEGVSWIGPLQNLKFQKFSLRLYQSVVIKD